MGYILGLAVVESEGLCVWEGNVGRSLEELSHIEVSDSQVSSTVIVERVRGEEDLYRKGARIVPNGCGQIESPVHAFKAKQPKENNRLWAG